MSSKHWRLSKWTKVKVQSKLKLILIIHYTSLCSVQLKLVLVVYFECCWICLCSVGGQQSAPPPAGLPPQSAAGRLPPPPSTTQLPAPASFPPAVSAGPPRGVQPPSGGQMHQMPPMPGGVGQRPPGAMPPRPPGAQQPPPSVSICGLVMLSHLCLHTT